MPRHYRLQMQVQPRVPVSTPPRGQVNDGDFAHLYSANILYDPGVELFVGNAAATYEGSVWQSKTGLRRYTIPCYDPTKSYSQVWPNGDAVAYKDISQWVALKATPTGYAVDGSVDSAAWHVSRYAPFVGTYHLVWDNWRSGPLGNPVPLMAQGPGLPGGYSARVDPGDDVTFSVYCALWAYAEEGLSNSWSNAGDLTASSVLYFYDQSGTLIVGSGNYYGAIDKYDSFSIHSHTAIAPVGSYFVRAFVAFTANTPSELDEFLDPFLIVDGGILSVT